MPVTAEGAAVEPSRGARLAELLLVGGATPVAFALSWALRRVVGLDAAELAVGFVFFHAAHVLNDPHFCVTYLLFYRDARGKALGQGVSALQRLRWWLAGLVAPVALGAWCVSALSARSAHSLGLLTQLMFLLVGWHYVKQGFGVMAVLSARRGHAFGPLERGAMLAHCYLAWAHAWASPADPGTEVEEKGVVYTTIAHGKPLETVTFWLFVASFVVMALSLLRAAIAARKAPPLLPLFAMLVSVWAWSVYSSIDPLVVYMIPAMHSAQYLYMVWLWRRNEARSSEGPPLFGKPASVQVGLLAAQAAALGLLMFHGAPRALDAVFFPFRAGAPGLYADIGPTPCLAAVVAFINIHHYLMDAVIWRRDNPETRFLRG